MNTLRGESFARKKKREILGIYFREWVIKSISRKIIFRVQLEKWISRGINFRDFALLCCFLLYILEFWPQKQKYLYQTWIILSVIELD